jgi:hypothetical protein
MENFHGAELMNSLARGVVKSNVAALVPALVILAFTGSLAFAQGGIESDDDAPGTPLAVTGQSVARENSAMSALGVWEPYEPGTLGHDGAGDHALRAWLWEQRVACITRGHGGLGYGTLGYGGHGLDLGFYGFGLSFHRGYGYGGRALGVGASGGYPYYGGPGYPSDSHAQYFTGAPPLVVARPVALEAFEPGTPAFPGDYGPFTGAIPYPETLFAPYVNAAAATGSSTGASPRPPSPPPAGNSPPPGPR